MRIFKTKWLAREVSSHDISDNELYQATQSALQGGVVSLGEGIYKKRLNKSRDRAIILTKSAGHWFYTFLYTKQDMANINHRELMGSYELARRYTNFSEKETTVLVKGEELVEICNDSRKQIQKPGFRSGPQHCVGAIQR